MPQIMIEKDAEKLSTDTRKQPRKQWAHRAAVGVVSLLTAAYHLSHYGYGTRSSSLISPLEATTCPAQVDPLIPSLPFTIDLTAYRNYSASLLSQAVQHRTVSYDDNGSVQDDDRWEPFFGFHEWLGETFKDVLQNEAVAVTKVNTLGFLTEWRGSDEGLKPLMLMSHLDVVPVEEKTVDRWTHPPFSGHNDGKYIWGRGAADDKT